MTRRTAHALVLGALLAASCAAEPTQTTLSIDLEAGLRSRAAAIRVSVFPSPGDLDSLPLTEHEFGRSSALVLPLDVAIAPQDREPDRAFRARLEVLDEASAVTATLDIVGAFVGSLRARVLVPDCCSGDPLCDTIWLDVAAPDALVTARCGADPPPSAAPLLAPRLLTPANGELTGSALVAGTLTPRFSWAAVPDARRYELALARGCVSPSSCAFDSAAIVSVAGVEHVPQEPLGASTTAPVGDRWGFRARACNDVGCGPWSEGRVVDVGRARSDLDGDGRSDVVIGAPARADGGAVIAFLGSADGLADAPLLHAPAAPGALLGTSVAIADLDGDGRAEVLAGAPGAGRVDVLRHDGTGLAVVRTLALAGGLPADEYGAAVAAVDFDGDGDRDVVVGAPGALGGGVVAIHRTEGGLPSESPTTTVASPGPERWGALVRDAGDTDGDGGSEVLVVAARGEPSAFLFTATTLFDRGASPIALGADGRGVESFGRAAWGGARVDGDGLADLVLGAPDAGDGLVFVRAGGSGATQPFASGLDLGAARLGAAVCVATRPGLPDAIVAGADAAGDRGADGSGAVLVFDRDGDPVRLLPPAPQTGARFGAALVVPGDVHGDGHDDLVVLSPLFDGATLDEGRAFLFSGASEQRFVPGPVELATPVPGGLRALP